jgi:hypothetical protein
MSNTDLQVSAPTCIRNSSSSSSSNKNKNKKRPRVQAYEELETQLSPTRRNKLRQIMGVFDLEEMDVMKDALHVYVNLGRKQCYLDRDHLVFLHEVLADQDTAESSIATSKLVSWLQDRLSEPGHSFSVDEDICELLFELCAAPVFRPYLMGFWTEFRRHLFLSMQCTPSPTSPFAKHRIDALGRTSSPDNDLSLNHKLHQDLRNWVDRLCIEGVDPGVMRSIHAPASSVSSSFPFPSDCLTVETSFFKTGQTRRSRRMYHVITSLKRCMRSEGLDMFLEETVQQMTDDVLDETYNLVCTQVYRIPAEMSPESMCWQHLVQTLVFRSNERPPKDPLQSWVRHFQHCAGNSQTWFQARALLLSEHLQKHRVAPI